MHLLCFENEMDVQIVCFNWVLTPSIVELYFNCLIALSTNININVGSTKPLRIKLVCAELHPSLSTVKM